MQYITARQVSEKTGLKYTTVLEWAKEGLLPARIIPHGKKSKCFFIEKEVEAKIEAFKIDDLKS